MSQRIAREDNQLKVRIVAPVIGDLALANIKKTSSSPPRDNAWTLASAKARLSELVDLAQAGPQTITRNRKPAAVIVSAEEWTRKIESKGTLAEFLLASPLRGADLELRNPWDE